VISSVAGVSRTAHSFSVDLSKGLVLTGVQNNENVVSNWVEDLRFSRRWPWRMGSSGMLRRVALVRTDVSEEFRASFIWVTRIGELETTLAVTSKRHTHLFLRSVRRLLVTASVVPSSPILITLMKEALSSSETSVLTTHDVTSQKTPLFIEWKFPLLVLWIFWLDMWRKKSLGEICDEAFGAYNIKNSSWLERLTEADI
jgi:hypothetical protein